MTRAGAPPRDGVRPFTSNRLLPVLPASTLQRLWYQLEPVPLTARQLVYQADEAITAVYFVESGLCSLMTTTREGHGVEAAAVGNEGLLGLAAGLSLGVATASMPVDTLVQVPGTALRMSADAFQRELMRDAALRDVVNRYAHALLASLLQSAACNRLHGLEERCCRWLLAARDRLERHTFPVTQELLAAALGVRRPSLSLVLNALQRAGHIAYSRGQITIRNRRSLESTACECYGIVRGQYERVLSPKAG